MQEILSRYTAILVIFLLSGCSAVAPTMDSGYQKAFGQPDRQTENSQTGVAVPTQQPAGYDQKQVLQAQEMHARKVEVTITARVYKLLPDDTKGLPHQRFLLLLSNGTTVLIAHDTKLAPRVPINQGDIVQVHGEYIWNEKGGVIHWTHHSPNGRHFGGWIDHMGQRYQ